MTLVTDLLGLEPEDKTLEFFLKGTSINRPYPPPDHASRAPTMRLLVF